jgi:hypothetical protein
MLIPVISLYVLILLLVLLKITWKYEPKRKLVNEVGVPEELLKYIYPAVDLLGLKGTVVITKYKEKKGEVVITDGKLKFTIGGLKEGIIV